MTADGRLLIMVPDGDFTDVIDDEIDENGRGRSVWLLPMAGNDGHRYVDLTVGESEYQVADVALNVDEVGQLIDALITMREQIKAATGAELRQEPL